VDWSLLYFGGFKRYALKSVDDYDDDSLVSLPRLHPIISFLSHLLVKQRIFWFSSSSLLVEKNVLTENCQRNHRLFADLQIPDPLILVLSIIICADAKFQSNYLNRV
jgi:hypothetical protein